MFKVNNKDKLLDKLIKLNKDKLNKLCLMLTLNIFHSFSYFTFSSVFLLTWGPTLSIYKR